MKLQVQKVKKHLRENVVYWFVIYTIVLLSKGGDDPYTTIATLYPDRLLELVLSNIRR